MKYELNSLIKHNVWNIVDMQEKTKLIKSKWVYALKKGDNQEIKYKV